jgi:hypothetical protein
LAGVVTAVATGWLVASAIAPAAAAASQRATDPNTATVGTATEAWYNVTQACDSGGACGPLALASADPYPAGTLHVGIQGGQESSRSYLRLDLSSLPPGTAVSGGTLTASIGGSSDGTQSAGTASIEACLVPQAFHASAGGFAPPTVDCSIKTSAVQTRSTPHQLTVDLAVFASAWSSHPEYGLALLPADDARTKGSSWHVALEGRGDTETGAQPISAAVSYQPAPLAAAGTSPAAGPTATDQPGAAGGESQSSLGDQAAALPTGPDGLVTPVPAATATQATSRAQPRNGGTTRRLTSPSSFIGANGGTYAAVWLVPLVLVLLSAFFAFALTHQIRLDDDVP